MYRVEWMVIGEKSIRWDGFADAMVAMRYMEGKRKNKNVTSIVLVAPWDNRIW